MDQQTFDALRLRVAEENKKTSAREVKAFESSPPDRYFAYVDEKRKLLTTWIGEKLGDIHFGRTWRSNFGDVRQSIIVKAINGKTYHGTYYKSSGNYARLQIKKQS